MNDPLGSMSKGLSSANQKLKENAQYAAESIKNNEELKQKLRNAKEKASSGLQYAKESSYSAAEKMKVNANNLYEKNYHGQLAVGIGNAYTSAASKASEYKKNYYHKDGYEYDQRITDDGYEMPDNYKTPGYQTYGRDVDDYDNTTPSSNTNEY